MTTPSSLTVEGHTYRYFPVSKQTTGLPKTIAILVENLVRHGGDPVVIDALTKWPAGLDHNQEIEFRPARVIMQDFTGVPCVVDLATLREAVAELGGDPARVNPMVPTQLVIDHSVIADEYGTSSSFVHNVALEYARNQERYQFLKWGQQAFSNFQVVPPGVGIVHQVNIEHLAQVVMMDQDLIYPDSCVGTDSHTTMVNALGVLGWGVGGIEAEAAMLGQPISMTLPWVVGVELTGQLAAGVMATDLVLSITQRLRSYGVVGKFVEFFGDAVSRLPIETRATVSNMCPEYGSTACLFPIDDRTIDYLKMTGRDVHQINLVAAYAKAQGLWADPTCRVSYSEQLTIDLGEVRPGLAGPKRPQDHIDLADTVQAFHRGLAEANQTPVTVTSSLGELTSGLVGIAAITSCTNTSNPQVMIAAGLLAKNAVEKGLSTKAWVKTTLSPGSQVVMDYLDQAGLTPYLEKLGFYLVGFGCVTCIGNSGPIHEAVRQGVDQGVVAVAVLSGNRNFEGRISPDIRQNYLASPPLVIAFGLAGTIDIDLTTQPLGFDGQTPVFLKDIWPSNEQIAEVVSQVVHPQLFTQRYRTAFSGSKRWQELECLLTDNYQWPPSTYIQRAPFFKDLDRSPRPLQDIEAARILLMLSDFVTTDHISPAGSIKPDSAAGRYLADRQVAPKDFNSYGSRRGNHEVMMRGTFANIRLRNQMVHGTEGGFTLDFTKNPAPIVSVFEAAQSYARQDIPLIVVAGKEYGSGSSRDWAAKGTALLGVKAVLAESYERIHRSNLIGMGILPMQFLPGESAKTWGLTGDETITIVWASHLNMSAQLDVLVDATPHQVILRVDTPTEVTYIRHGGILPYQARVLAGLA